MAYEAGVTTTAVALVVVEVGAVVAVVEQGEAAGAIAQWRQIMSNRSRLQTGFNIHT